MFLPIGDTPNPRGFVPWMTWLLLAVNALVYLLWTLPLSFTPVDPADPALPALVERWLRALPPGASLEEVTRGISRWDLFVEQHGYVPSAPSVADLFAAMFLHAGLAHVAGNLLFLWIYGDNVEHRLGRLGFLAAYLGTGVVATLAFAAFAPMPDTPLVGASGAISGVLGAYFLFFPRNRVRVFVALFPFVMDVWLVPAPIVLGLFVLVDNLLPFFVGGAGGVAYGAHLGGFVAGAVVAWALRNRGELPPEGPGPSDAGEDPASTAEALVRGGQPGAALAAVRAGLARRPSALEEARLRTIAGEVLAEAGQTSAAFQHLVRALHLDPDPATRTRVQAALAGLGIDPRLAARLGVDEPGGG